MEKQERFAIYAYVRGFFGDVDHKTDKKVFITDTVEYPTNDQMELAWRKAIDSYTQVFHLNVEKQVRFN
jgi:hypothetical protein